MRWNEPFGARCDRCHGDPPEGHVSSDCASCHPSDTHIDGAIDVGVECTDCHGTVPDSGAHRAHLTPGDFADAFDCVDCHAVPSERDAPGHIDSDRPAELTFTTSVATGRTTASWDGARCSDVGCHGGGFDAPSNLTPVWTETATVACGDCHGLPPLAVRGGESYHYPTGSEDCGGCHAGPDRVPITIGTSSIAPEGRARHIDGCVDLPGRCPP